MFSSSEILLTITNYWKETNTFLPQSDEGTRLTIWMGKSMNRHNTETAVEEVLLSALPPALVALVRSQAGPKPGPTCFCGQPPPRAYRARRDRRLGHEALWCKREWRNRARRDRWLATEYDRGRQNRHRTQPTPRLNRHRKALAVPKER